MQEKLENIYVMAGSEQGSWAKSKILILEERKTYEVAMDQMEASMVVVVTTDCLADQNDLVLAA